MAAVSRSINTSPQFSGQLRNFGLVSLVTLFAGIILVGFLTPFAYMSLTSLKDKDQIVASATGSILPVDNITFNFEKRRGK